jgi:methyl acetate hydrolase
MSDFIVLVSYYQFRSGGDIFKLSFCRKQNIFHPLGIKASFYLTPDLKEKKVAFVLRNEGDLLAVDPNVRLFETDPEKGMCNPCHTFVSSLINTKILVHLRLGGVGLYASARGYLTLLRHLLQICGL